MSTLLVCGLSGAGIPKDGDLTSMGQCIFLNESSTLLDVQHCDLGFN